MVDRLSQMLGEAPEHHNGHMHHPPGEDTEDMEKFDDAPDDV